MANDTEKLTLEKAKKLFNDIENSVDDDEAAHILEDELMAEFIKSVASGLYTDISEVIEIAKVVNSTQSIIFCRWYA